MRIVAVICAASLATPALAAGPSFALVGKPGGAPQIGGIVGSTLYGTQADGGANGAGAFFSLTLSGVYTNLHNFVGDRDGSGANARLAITADQTIWGTAQDGGMYGGGTLFSWTAAKGFGVRHSFGRGSDGVAPLQGPVRGGAAAVYGTTSGGAHATNGNLWFFGSDGYAARYEFMSNGDGHCPFSGPYYARNGLVYGTTLGHGYGGEPNGSVWSFKSNVPTTLYEFTDGNDGEWPDQSPVVDAEGNVYGTTHVRGGSDFAGAIWKISSIGAFRVLHDLNGTTDGYAPNSPLLLNTDGYLYGTTASGGSAGYGTVFRIAPAGGFELVHSFSGGADGAYPTGNLVNDGTGSIFGGTQSGTVFKITY